MENKKKFVIKYKVSGFIEYEDESKTYINSDKTAMNVSCEKCKVCKTKNIAKCKIQDWFLENDISKITTFDGVAKNVNVSHSIENDVNGKPEKSVVTVDFGDVGKNYLSACTQVGVWLGYAMGQKSL